MTLSGDQHDCRDGPPPTAVHGRDGRKGRGLRAGGHRPDRRRRPRSRWRQVTVVVLLVAGLVGLVPETGPLPATDSPAAAEDCASEQESGGGAFYNGVECPPGGPEAPPDPDPPPAGGNDDGGSDDGGSDDSGSGDGGGSSEPVCRYIRVGNPELAIAVYEQAGREVPSGYPYLNECTDAEVGGTIGTQHMENLASLYSPDDFVFINEFDNSISAIATTVALETELLDAAWAEVEGQLAEPEPVVYPPSGMPTLVGVPTLLSVDNPQEEIVYGPNCADPPADDVCVSVTATPSLTFDPGDGTDSVSCDAAGTTYDPGGPSVSEQAEGGCAHAYSRVSDAEGYPGRLTLTWDVLWENTLGESGEFDPITLPSGDEPNVTRIVQELHAVVDEVEPGGSSE